MKDNRSLKSSKSGSRTQAAGSQNPAFHSSMTTRTPKSPRTGLMNKLFNRSNNASAQGIDHQQVLPTGAENLLDNPGQPMDVCVLFFFFFHHSRSVIDLDFRHK